ncbi:hypothetical protein [Burkholderia guangdongensis]|uniref:hypothetical protein n=1 Tax=Burkholderia guangdongensis TaxID=1792500 RepID=UPI0015CC621E|nr:hypothetical protein [Burkholderia guangdongensis]
MNSTEDVKKNTSTATTRTFCIDKFIELDFNFAKEETQHRTEFNRRILNLQMSLITGVLAAGVIKDVLSINPFTLQFLCISIVFINTVFLIEINQNNFYITLAARYLATVVNKRGREFSGDQYDFYEWEKFLEIKRDASHSLLSRMAFLLDAHFFMSILFLIISTITLGISTNNSGLQHPYVIIPYALATYSLNLLCIYRHFSIPRELKEIHKKEEVMEFFDKNSI